MASPDGTRIIPAATVVDAAGVVWTISYLFAQRGGYNTTAHASELLWRGGTVYVKGRNLHWWKLLGVNQWVDVGPTEPGTVSKAVYLSGTDLQLPAPKATAGYLSQVVLKLAKES
jgi:hypothetical protein